MNKIKIIGISILVLLGLGLIVNLIPDSLFDDTESRTYKGITYEYGYYYEGPDGLRSRFHRGFLLSSDDGVVFTFAYKTGNANYDTYSAYGTFTGIIGKSIVIRNNYFVFCHIFYQGYMICDCNIQNASTITDVHNGGLFSRHLYT